MRSPHIQPDGTIHFRDDEGSTATRDVNRYVAWDPAAKATKVLYRSGKSFSGVRAGPDGQFLYLEQKPDADDRVVTVNADGAKRTFTIAPRIGGSLWGDDRRIAVTVPGAGEGFPPPTGLVLLDPTSGKKTTVQGWAPIAWSADGTRLLGVRATDPAGPDAELAIMDPARPESPQVLGRLPRLTIFQSSWVDQRSPATATPAAS